MQTNSRRKHRILSPIAGNSLIVGYIRASTVKQKLSIPTQQSSIDSGAERKHFQLAQSFVDAGLDGKTEFLRRETVLEMLRFMAAENIQQIMFTRLDRAFRNQVDAIHTIDKLLEIGVIVHFSEHDMEFKGAMGRAMLQMIAIFAELETNIRLERQLDTYDEARRQNWKMSRKPRYGWTPVASDLRKTTVAREKENLDIGSKTAFDYVPDWHEQEYLREIVARHEKGEADAHIARLLNLAEVPTKFGHKWHASTVFSVRSFAVLANREEWDKKAA